MDTEGTMFLQEISEQSKVILMKECRERKGEIKK
jgi:hypothetical protein